MYKTQTSETFVESVNWTENNYSANCAIQRKQREHKMRQYRKKPNNREMKPIEFFRDYDNIIQYSMKEK